VQSVASSNLTRAQNMRNWNRKW